MYFGNRVLLKCNRNYEMQIVLLLFMGDKCECSNSRGISLLSVVGKLFGRVLIKRVRGGTECAILEEHAGTECAIGQSNVGLGRVEDAWTNCLLYGRCVKSISQMGKMYSGRL